MLLKPISDVVDQLNINPLHTFDSLVLTPAIRPAVNAVKGVLDGPRSMAMIYGDPGNGKTHLLEAAAIELYSRGLFTKVCLFADLLFTLKESIDNPNMYYQDILKNHVYAKRLLLDDVGAKGTNTEFGDKILEDIVCSRYGYQLMTIITTNKDISTLPERVLSRLNDKSICFLVHNKAEDYRPKLEAE